MLLAFKKNKDNYYLSQFLSSKTPLAMLILFASKQISHHFTVFVFTPSFKPNLVKLRLSNSNDILTFTII